MIAWVQRHIVDNRLWIWALVAGVLLGAAGLSYVTPKWGFVLLVMGLGFLVLLQHPYLSPFAIVVAALTIRSELGTGSEVTLNAATMLVPVSLAVWLIDIVRQGQHRLLASRVNLPLLLFLAAGLVSLLVGSATWDPAVPRSSQFLIVQLAQWAIFVFSGLAFWLTAHLMTEVAWLHRLTFFYIALAGGLAILRVVPASADAVLNYATFAVERAPFWMLLTSVAGGQVLFNKGLSNGWRWFQIGVLVAAFAYALVFHRATASNWVGVVAVLGVLFWLRWSRLRWPVILLLTALGVTGVLSSAIYDFAGGDDEWVESGGSRLLLIERVIKVTMRNPVTGLGPAAYRPYTAMEPLMYYRAYWVAPQINSHNNWVDLFSQVGLLGLGVFVWFAIEVTALGFRLRRRYPEGFAAGYVNAMLATWAGSLVMMLFADWILPFVYNIGFSGFQASVLVWLFLGGLVALEHAEGTHGSGAADGEWRD